ncbi:MAG: hypothetical protein WCO60_16560 [Verrucomicrobiota bacterium]
MSNSLRTRELAGPGLLMLVTGCFPFIGMAAQSGGREICRIEVVEKESGWPVPLVELRTTHHVRFVSDNAGVIAFDLPELMGREVWFDVQGQSYGVSKDGFGFSGIRIKPEAGKTLKVEVERRCIAKRIGRLTGAGIFAESQRFGEDADWQESGITGSDSVQCVPYQGRLLWLWGDTNIPQYALGIFSSSGATSKTPASEELLPPLRLPLDYFRDDRGAPRGIAPVPGDGPTWVFGMVEMRDKSGTEKVGGYYSKIRGSMESYETGLVVWNDEKRLFERSLVVWEKASGKPLPKSVPAGQASKWRDQSGREWLLFGNPFPVLKCPATFEAWSDRSTWEALTTQDRFRSADGQWVRPHTGAIGFHPWRKKWVAVFMEKGGKPSALGELWYTEAEQPTGPWGTAVKILSHDNYTFYNPRLHLDFTPDGKPWLYFEGTYTVFFTKNNAPTPRYDYNQILYRLDLDDPALKPAQRE